jgi:hypothetical protein
VQSGAQTVELHVASTFTASGTSSFIDDDGHTLAGISFGTEGVPVKGYFDAASGAIVVEDIVPQGGRITLAGQIISTGHGLLRVANGYASVTITNDSAYDLVVNRIDTTTKREGRITIIDTVTLRKVEYVADGSSILENQYTGALVQGSDSSNGLDTLTYTLDAANSTTHSFGDTITYQPRVGQYYMWVEGQELTQVTLTKWEKSSFNLFGGGTSFEDSLSKDTSYKWKTIEFRDEIPLLESEAVAVETPILFAADGVTPLESIVPDPDYAYTIVYEQKADADVDLIPGVTLVWDVVGLKAYKYKSDQAAKQAVLSTINYATSSEWELQSSITTAFANDPASSQYKSDFVNYTRTVETWTTGGGWLRKKTNHTLLTEIEGKTDYYTHTLQADKPISIEFIQGPATPTISITTTHNLLLQGNLQVTDGTWKSPKPGAPRLETPNAEITLSATTGSITMGQGTAIFGDSPTVTARDGVTLYVEGNKGSIEVTNTGTGDIVITAFAGAATFSSASASETGTPGVASLLIHKMQTADGDVQLTAPGGMAYASTPITGRIVQLYAGSGSIGTAANPIEIDSSFGGLGGFAAYANGSIYVRETSGVMRLTSPTLWGETPISVYSAAGDVWLATTDGSIIDGIFEEFRPPSEEEIAALNSQMALSGALARLAAESSIRSEENQRTQFYHQYWLNVRGATATVVDAVDLQSANNASEIVTFAASHGFDTGDQFSLTFAAGATASNLNAGTPYYAVKVSNTQIRFATTRGDAYLLADFQHTVTATNALVKVGDRVQLANGTIYQYIGETELASANLADGTQHYATSTSWKFLKAPVNIEFAGGGSVSGVSSATYSYTVPVAYDSDLSRDDVNLATENYNNTSQWLLLKVAFDLSGPGSFTSVNLNPGQIVKKADGTLYEYTGAFASSVNLVATTFVSPNWTLIDVDHTSADSDFTSADLDYLDVVQRANGTLYQYRLPAGLLQVHTTLGSGSYNQDYAFQYTAAEKTALIEARTFSLGQLQNPVSRSVFNFLYPDAPFFGSVGSTPAGVEETLNLYGNTITLVAGTQGGVGQASGLQVIDLKAGFSQLTQAQQAALSLATKDDILAVDYAVYQYKGAAGTVDLLKADFTNAALWTKLTPNFTVTGSAAQLVNIGTNNLVQVKIPQTADGQSLFGLYRYKGGNTTLDLSSQNYRSSGSWERVAQFDTGQGTASLTANAYVGRVEGLTIDVWSDVDVHAKTKLRSMPMQPCRSARRRISSSSRSPPAARCASNRRNRSRISAAARSRSERSATSCCRRRLGRGMDERRRGQREVVPHRARRRCRRRRRHVLGQRRRQPQRRPGRAGSVTIRGDSHTISLLRVSSIAADGFIDVEVKGGDLSAGSLASKTSIDLKASGSILDRSADDAAPLTNVFTGSGSALMVNATWQRHAHRSRRQHRHRKRLPRCGDQDRPPRGDGPEQHLHPQHRQSQNRAGSIDGGRRLYDVDRLAADGRRRRGRRRNR